MRNGITPNELEKIARKIIKIENSRKWIKLARFLYSIRPNIKDIYSTSSLLHELIARDAVVSAKILIDAGTNINFCDSDGMSVLNMAAFLANNSFRKTKINADFIKFLLDAEAEVNSSSNSGYTPLIQACSGKDDPEIVKMLVEAGANINAFEKVTGKTALGFAKEHGLAKIEEYLRSVGAEKEFDEKTRNKFEYAEQNSRNGSFCSNSEKSFTDNVNSSTRYGETPLMVACENHRFDDAVKLISAGAGVNAFDAQGRTALICIFASMNKLWSNRRVYYEDDVLKLVNLLIKSKADVNLKDNYGDTALSYALNLNFFSTAVLLLAGGADASFCNTDGVTALDKAISLEPCELHLWGNLEPIKIKRKKSIARNSLAHKLLVHALIKAGADVNRAGRDGLTPLQLARSLKLYDIERELMAHGAREI